MDQLPRRLAVARLVLQTHFVLMLGALFVPDIGKALRLVAEQTGHIIGRGLTGDAPDEFLLVLHLAATFLLGVALWSWGRGDPLTRRVLLAAAVAMLPLAPLGLPLAWLLFWMWRQKAFEEASEHMPEVAGSRRAGVVTAWIVACIISTVSAYGAFLLFGSGFLWLPAMLASPAPNGLLLWSLLAERPPEQIVEAPMPPLPDRLDQEGWP